MRVVDVKLGTIKAELKKPFITNLRKVNEIEDVCLTMICDNGVIGYGEAPPTVAITGEDIASINDTIATKIFPAIKDIDIENESDIFGALHSSVGKSTSAKACVDMALYDALSKSQNLPLYEYLGGTKRVLQTNLTISLNDINTMLDDSVAAYNEGFRILKIKVGKDVDDAVSAIELIRQSLPEALLRVDANQAWSEMESLKVIERIAKCNIELLEQPVRFDDIRAMKNITARSQIPILADESVFSYDDAVRLIDEKACDYINIKLMKSGGIHEAMKIVRLAKASGTKVMMGSMLESVISISAGVHLSMVDEIISFFDLDGIYLSKPSSIKNSLRLLSDTISLDCAGGLGIELS